MKRKKINNQHGQFSFLLIFSIVSLLLIASLAVDGGRLYFSWTALSRALDAACSSVIHKSANLTDTQIQTAVDQVARYNLQTQGVNVQNVAINTDVIHNAASNSLFKLNITGTISNFASALLTRAPGQPHANITAQTTCPTCYQNTTPFTVPGGPTEGGKNCQKACNDGAYTISGTNACCSYSHGTIYGQNTTTCTCATTALQATYTENCIPGAKPAEAVTATNNGYIEPAWIDRNDQDILAAECNAECTQHLSYTNSALWCNEGCGGENGTVCCKCICTMDAGCPGTLPLCQACGNCPLCGDGFCSAAEKCKCPQDCGVCPACDGSHPCPAGLCCDNGSCGDCPCGSDTECGDPNTLVCMGTVVDSDTSYRTCHPQACEPSFSGAPCGVGDCCQEGLCTDGCADSNCTGTCCAYGCKSGTAPGNCASGTCCASCNPPPSCEEKGGVCCLPHDCDADALNCIPGACDASGPAQGICPLGPCCVSCAT